LVPIAQRLGRLTGFSLLHDASTVIPERDVYETDHDFDVERRPSDNGPQPTAVECGHPGTGQPSHDTETMDVARKRPMVTKPRVQIGEAAKEEAQGAHVRNLTKARKGVGSALWRERHVGLMALPDIEGWEPRVDGGHVAAGV